MFAPDGEWLLIVPIAPRSGRRKGQPMFGKLVHLRRLLIVAPFAVAFVLASIAVVGLSGPNRADAQGTAAVDIANFAFSPASLTIEAGTTVTWTNSDSVAHTATGDTFDTGELAPGESGSVTFDTEGTFNYICSIHPNMTGTIMVTAAGGQPAPTATAPSTGLPTTGSGSSLSSTASQANILLIAAVASAALGLVALRLRRMADRRL
jgi:plastocyanin